MKTVLTIAGSDCSGGAGIQADIKTMTVNGVYAMSVVTALTAQNTMGIRAIQEVSLEFLAHQLDAVFEDIFPDAVKIGMIPSKEHMLVICEKLKYYGAKKVVIDPVMVATSGASLMKNDSVKTLKEELFPLATLVTPNIFEAQILSGVTIKTKEDMMTAAKIIGDYSNCSVLLKGGHNMDNSHDLLYKNGEYIWFEGNRIENPNTHGTGCTLSSAVSVNFAKGYTVEQSVFKAKEYITKVISAQLNLGHGRGPLNHSFSITE